MIMCVLLCYPVSIHMSQLLSTGCPISSLEYAVVTFQPIRGHMTKNVFFRWISLSG